ncbi:cupin [Pseudoalteromonas sp. NBT06-2]|uniref:cupin domain-containing protein n=1 Tax=Pseudoalteromonas sp. NBT06-2 TaxID=2025950 RepID=UPI000BA7274E|nr:cupin domain-containing protein [Pseudoalteromonas sp. NBT06-2]PAJ75334.1 cupin [Pseudoalteromonas sp. NBT06-2]
MNNIFKEIPDDLSSEVFENLASGMNVKIERILSKGHSSPVTGWYDQTQNEWVIVLKGEAILTFNNKPDVQLKQGDYLNIKAHQKHKVSWTTPEEETVWLAIHYD